MTQHESDSRTALYASINDYVDDLAGNDEARTTALTAHILAVVGNTFANVTAVSLHDDHRFDLERIEWSMLCAFKLAQELDPDCCYHATLEAVRSIFSTLSALLTTSLHGVLEPSESASGESAREALATLIRTIDQGVRDNDEPRAETASIPQMVEGIRALAAGEVMDIVSPSPRRTKSKHGYSLAKVRLEAWLCREQLVKTGLSAADASAAFSENFQGVPWDTARKWPDEALFAFKDRDEIRKFIDDRRLALGVPEFERRNVFIDRLRELAPVFRKLRQPS